VIRPGWLIGGLALACVLAIVWPSGAVRRRLREPGSGSGLAVPSVDLARVRGRLESLAVRRPGRFIGLAAVLAALLGEISGGPVAALVSVVYGALGARALARRIAKRSDTAARARQLDDLSALAADLRAGLPSAAASDLHTTLSTGTPPFAIHSGDGRTSAGSLRPARTGPNRGFVGAVSKHAIHHELRITALTAAVWRLAEQTGAPAADLVDRIEADARAADRAQASAAAQAAGAQATALLLAALPLGGIALGYAIGADPLQVLLHTPLGAACAAGAVLLQCAGLFWADRLTNGPAR
jgi:tight adherence protein B